MNTSLERWPLSAIFPYERSLKIRNKAKVKSIADSIQLYGFDQPIVITETGEIIKGVGRYEALQLLQRTEATVIVNSSLSESEIISARIADNKVAESEWDKEYLFQEVDMLTREGISPQAFGFDLKALQKMFPELLLDLNGELDNKATKGIGSKSDDDEDDLLPDFDNEDHTFVEEPSSIFPFIGDKRYLRHLSHVDYLDTHPKIALCLSGGATSIASLLWLIDQGFKDKLYVLYSSVGWNIEDPTMYQYLKTVEEKTGVEIHMVGSMNPRSPSGFEDYITQFGMPSPKYGCWVERELRNPRIWSLSEGSFGLEEAVWIFNARWEDSVTKRANFPDRGEMVTGTGTMHYSNPLYLWSTVDVMRYLWKKGHRIAPMYLTQNKTNCAICPRNRAEYFIWYRKTFPVLWAKMLGYYAKGSLFTGEMSSSVLKVLSDLDHPNVNPQEFTGKSAGLSMRATEFELSQESMNSEFVVRDHSLFVDILHGAPVYRVENNLASLEICK